MTLTRCLFGVNEYNSMPYTVHKYACIIIYKGMPLIMMTSIVMWFCATRFVPRRYPSHRKLKESTQIQHEKCVYRKNCSLHFNIARSRQKSYFSNQILS